MLCLDSSIWSTKTKVWSQTAPVLLTLSMPSSSCDHRHEPPHPVYLLRWVCSN
jgi:hypothetical protein